MSEAKTASPSAPTDVLAQAALWRDAGRGVALATVVKTWGSSPRPAGSQLAVDDRGAFVGSVSGGCVEGAVVASALEVIKDRAPRVLEFGVSEDDAWAVGLACGGRIQIFVEPVPERAATGSLLDRILSDRAARRPFVIATRLPDGSQQLVHPDDGSAGEPSALAMAARAALDHDVAETVTIDDATWLLAPHNPPLRLLVLGAVHISQALVPMARLLDLEVTLIDPRRAFATADRFPEVTLLDEWPDTAFARLGLDRRTAVVTLTHDKKLDDPAIALALASPVFYIGALGSRKTQEARKRRLAETFSEADLARIHGPVGLPIGARTPAEVALAILAELVQALRKPMPRPVEP